MMPNRRISFWYAVLIIVRPGGACGAGSQVKPPVRVGLDAEFGHAANTSAEAIRRGILVAIDEIKKHGGGLNGRPLVLEVQYNRSVCARSIDNLKIDLSVVHTYSFLTASNPIAWQVLDALKRLFNVRGPRLIASPEGVAHAYDLLHLLARAINLAGVTDRGKVRDARDNLPAYQGLVRHDTVPFPTGRHDALKSGNIFLARLVNNSAIAKATAIVVHK